MADQQRRNPLLGCHKERFPSTWPGVSSLPKEPVAKEPVATPYIHDNDELPKWNTTKRLVANGVRKRTVGGVPVLQVVGAPPRPQPQPQPQQQQQPLPPAQRLVPHGPLRQGEAYGPRAGGLMLPARKAPGPAQPCQLSAHHSFGHLPKHRAAAATPQKPSPVHGALLSPGPSQPKLRPMSSGPRPAQVVVVGDKAWRVPHPDGAGKPAGGSISKPHTPSKPNTPSKPHTPSSSHSMINVDARSAPMGPTPAPVQRYPSADMRSAESQQPEQKLAARERSAFSTPAFASAAAPSPAQAQPHSRSFGGLNVRSGQPSLGTHTRQQDPPAPIPHVAAKPPWQKLGRIPIVCNGNRGYYVVDSGTCICCCVACSERAKRADLPCFQISPTEFERHSGMSATKKWKTTLRVERPTGRSISLGAHLEVNGIWTTGPPPPGVQGAAEFARPAQPAAPEPKPILHGLSQPQRAPSASPQAAARPPPAAVKPEAVLEQGVSVPISAEAPKAQQPHRGGPRTRGGHVSSAAQGRVNSQGNTTGAAPSNVEANLEDSGSRPANKATKGKWLKGAVKRNIKPQIRLGEEYQAAIPPLSEVEPRPAKEPSARDGGRGGTLVPSVAAALASVRGPEKAAADALPLDAKMDPTESIGKQILLQRGQRQRKKPQWLDNTIDPHLTDRKWGLPASHQEMLDYELLPDSDTGSDATLSVPRRRRRMAPGQPQHRRQDCDRMPVPEYYDGGEDDDCIPPVPKRMRSVAGDWPTSMALDSPSPRQAGSQPDAGAPQLLTHQVHQGGQILHVTISLQGCVYAGALVLESRGAGSEAALAPPQALAAAVLPAPKSLTADSLSAGAWAEEPGLAGSAAPTSSAPHANEQNLLDVPIGQVKLPRQLPLEEGVQEAQSIRAREKMPPAVPRPKGEERRAAAAEEYHRLLQEGAPPGTKCVLCHQEQHADAAQHLLAQRQIVRTPEGVSNRALGPLLLVRVSAISNAWVHMQCALWSGEVWVSETGGLEKVDEAVRRGRMIKCKACNRKGATLGCHIRSCRHSFHMVCARATKCRLHEDGRLTCPSHLHLVSAERPAAAPEPASDLAPERFPIVTGSRQPEAAARQKHPDVAE